ncbi:hypothetical protein E2C01_074689 [Portunus trituberculatus]|uniref:Uncharacterized protein n=1 Tax=Portunus trituberculatus TaxID=210409 RepID=A0A5B7I3Y3_PORTR|nr:hypothetical protein [Portunus trituberculatus]
MEEQSPLLPPAVISVSRDVMIHVSTLPFSCGFIYGLLSPLRLPSRHSSANHRVSSLCRHSILMEFLLFSGLAGLTPGSWPFSKPSYKKEEIHVLSINHIIDNDYIGSSGR